MLNGYTILLQVIIYSQVVICFVKNVIWMWWDKFWSEQLPNNSQLPSVTAVYIHHVIY